MTAHFRRTAGAAAALLLLTPFPGATKEPSSLLELVQTIRLNGGSGRLGHLALDGKGGRLFVANLPNSSLDVIDLNKGRVLKQLSHQGDIRGLAYVPGLDRIFVGDGESGVCRVLDGKDYTLLKSFALPDAVCIQYDPDSGRVYVAHAANSLAVIDARDLKIVGTIRLPGPPQGLQLDSGKSRIFVNCTSPNLVAVVDTAEQEVVTSFALERAMANFPLALDVHSNRVFVGCRRPEVVLVLDAGTGEEMSRINVPGDIGGLFYDARRRRLYGTCGEGYLVAIEQKDPDNYRLVAKRPTGKQARTGLFDPETGRFYAALPARDGKGPAIRVYQAKP